MSIIREIQEARRLIEQSKPVVVYQPAIEPDVAYIVSGELFEDGRQRLLFHPSHRELVDGWLASR